MNEPAPKKRRIAFVINSLGPGGAERVMATVLAHAPRDTWDVHLVLLDREPAHRTPPPYVTVHQLDCAGRLQASLSQLKQTMKSLRPDLVVSFLVRSNLAAVLAAKAVGAQVIISERSQLSTHLAEKHGRMWAGLAKLLPRAIYPRADHVLAVSAGVRSDLLARFGLRPARVSAIYNPYDLEAIVAEGAQPPSLPLPDRFMVSVGRLVEAKGFGDLLDAYALARPALPLVILGDGPDRADLVAHAVERGLIGRVLFAGYVSNPFAVVSRADLFVSASHCEGFPNAMAEAMALGVPVIATDCPSGPAELLHEVESTRTQDVLPGRHGVLTPVGRPDLLAAAITLLQDETLRRDYARRAQARMAGFALPQIMNQYWSLFETVHRRDVVTSDRSPFPGPTVQAAGRAAS